MFDRATVLVRRSFDVMGAERHGIRIASVFVSIVSTRHNTSLGEPVPRSANLASVAAHAEASHKVAAACGVSSTQKSLEFSFGFDAETVIESFSGAVSPAGTAVGLVSHMADDILAFRPGFSGIESGREVFA